MASHDVTSRSVVFRSAVIVGAVALLVGVAGIFYFRARENEERADHPRNACTVRVHGLRAVEGVEVEAAWPDEYGELSSERGRPARSAGVWIFEQAPEGVALTLRIRRRADAGVQLVHEQPAMFTRGAIFDVYLADGR